ncbi:MAG: hypothetical protein IPK04_22385 [Bdellovibrionales bacterium]|nr:hypothetical protein [Bdellovibrionales bacterium]
MNSLLSSAKTVTLSQGFNPGQLDPMAVLRQAQASGRDVFFYEASPEIGLTPEYAVIGLGPFKILRQRADKTELVLGIGSWPSTSLFCSPGGCPVTPESVLRSISLSKWGTLRNYWL